MDNPNQNPIPAKQSATCNCPHHKMVPALVVVFGALFLLGNLGLSWAVIGWVWPILVIAAGCMKLMGSKCKCC